MKLQTTEPNSIVAVIARAASDPSVDVAKMERLYAMMTAEHARIAEQQFNAAMTAAQAEMPMVMKTSKNPHTQSDYAKLETLKVAMAPIISKHGFSLMFSEGKSDSPDKIRVLCDVKHASGHTIQRYLDLSRDDTGAQGRASKTKIQGEGSTFSYGVRYLTTMLFNVIVAGIDQDGNKGSRPKPVVQTTTPELAALKKQLWARFESVHGGDKNKLRQHLVDDHGLDPDKPIEELTTDELRRILQ